MKAYKFRIHVEEDDSFLRDFELTENQSLMDFHNILTKNLNLNEEELASFFLTTENWEKEEEFTLLNMGFDTPNKDDDLSFPIKMMEESYIGKIIKAPKQRMLYEYNFMNPTIFYIDLIEIKEANPKSKYPKCTKSEGELDIEQSLSYLSDFEDIDDFRKTYAGMAEEEFDMEDLNFEDEEDEDIFGSGGGYESEDYY